VRRQQQADGARPRAGYNRRPTKKMMAHKAAEARRKQQFVLYLLREHPSGLTAHELTQRLRERLLRWSDAWIRAALKTLTDAGTIKAERRSGTILVYTVSDETCERVQDVLRESQNGLTAAELACEIGRSETRIRTLLNRMLAAGEVRIAGKKVGTGINNGARIWQTNTD